VEEDLAKVTSPAPGTSTRKVHVVNGRRAKQEDVRTGVLAKCHGDMERRKTSFGFFGDRRRSSSRGFFSVTSLRRSTSSVAAGAAGGDGDGGSAPAAAGSGKGGRSRRGSKADSSSAAKPPLPPPVETKTATSNRRDRWRLLASKVLLSNVDEEGPKGAEQRSWHTSR